MQHLRALFAPRILRAHFFLPVFFRVAREGLSGRTTSCSLSLLSKILVDWSCNNEFCLGRHQACYRYAQRVSSQETSNFPLAVWSIVSTHRKLLISLWYYCFTQDSVDLSISGHVTVRPIHPSILSRQHCFQVTTPHETKYFSCRSSQELEKWVVR